MLLYRYTWDDLGLLKEMRDIMGGGAGLTGPFVRAQELVLYFKGSEEPFKDLSKKDVIRSESHSAGFVENGLGDWKLWDYVLVRSESLNSVKEL